MASKVRFIGIFGVLIVACVLAGCGTPAGGGSGDGGDPLLGEGDDSGSTGGGMPAGSEAGSDDDSAGSGAGTGNDHSFDPDSVGDSSGDDDDSPPDIGDSDGTSDDPGSGQSDSGDDGGSTDDGPFDDGSGGGDDSVSSDESDFALTSRLLLDDQGFIDFRFAWIACGGNNVSPQLSWTDAPPDTESFVVVIFDEDAGDFIHWVVFDIAPSVLQISEGGPAPGGQTLNDFDQGQFGYGGPCPPAGQTHTYVFRVYALDVGNVGLTAGQATSLAELEGLMAGRILDEAEFTAEFARP